MRLCVVLATLLMVAPCHVLLALEPIAEVNLGYMPFDRYADPAVSSYQHSTPGGIQRFFIQDFTSTGPTPPAGFYGSLYNNQCRNPNGTYLSLRACTQLALLKYRQSGITGIRFFFGVCGAAASNPYILNGTSTPSCNPSLGTLVLNPQWTAGVAAFLDDVRSNSLRIAITPSFEQSGNQFIEVNGPGGFPGSNPSFEPCASSLFRRYRYYFASPNPYLVIFDDQAGEEYEDWIGYQVNQSYNCTPPNPHFMGWDRALAPLGHIISAAAQRSIPISEIDLFQEIRIMNITNQMRFIYDNTTYTWPYVKVAQQLGIAGYPFNLVTYSTVAENASNFPILISQNPAPTYVQTIECGSMYGDTARLIGQSALVTSLGGGRVGFPPTAGAVGMNGFWCGGNASHWVLLSSPFSAWAPGVIDIHSYPQFNRVEPSLINLVNRDMVRAEATRFFEALREHRFWYSTRGNGIGVYGSSPIIIGETHSAARNASLPSGYAPHLLESCDSAPDNPTVIARWYPWATRDGYDQSSWRLNAESLVLRPWSNPVSNVPDSSCFPWPNDKRLRDAYFVRPAVCPDDQCPQVP